MLLWHILLAGRSARKSQCNTEVHEGEIEALSTCFLEICDIQFSSIARKYPVHQPLSLEARPLRRRTVLLHDANSSVSSTEHTRSEKHIGKVFPSTSRTTWTAATKATPKGKVLGRQYVASMMPIGRCCHVRRRELAKLALYAVRFETLNQQHQHNLQHSLTGELLTQRACLCGRPTRRTRRPS